MYTKLFLKKLILGCLVASFISCTSGTTKQENYQETATATSPEPQGMDSIALNTDNLQVRRLSEHVYEHTSFLNTEDFGRVPCNGMIVVSGGEAVVFDTPANAESSERLISYIKNELGSEIKAVVATHFHADCVAGLEQFHANNTASYAHRKTITLLEAGESKFPKPQNAFEDVLTLTVGGKEVHAEYFGEGHTRDNVIAYFPEDKALFGGCLIKEVGAQEGNLADANVEAWSKTVKKIKERHPDVQIVIPGHGKLGGMALLDYTISLFER